MYQYIHERALNLINTILEMDTAYTKIVSYLCFYELKFEISHNFVSFTVLVFMVLFLYIYKYTILSVLFWFDFFSIWTLLGFRSKKQQQNSKNLLNCSKYSSTLCDLTRKMAKNACWPPNCPIRTEVSWDYFHR